jgi:hypothetical protein
MVYSILITPSLVRFKRNNLGIFLFYPLRVPPLSLPQSQEQYLGHLFRLSITKKVDSRSKVETRGRFIGE